MIISSPHRETSKPRSQCQAIVLLPGRRVDGQLLAKGDRRCRDNFRCIVPICPWAHNPEPMTRRLTVPTPRPPGLLPRKNRGGIPQGSSISMTSTLSRQRQTRKSGGAISQITESSHHPDRIGLSLSDELSTRSRTFFSHPPFLRCKWAAKGTPCGLRGLMAGNALAPLRRLPIASLLLINATSPAHPR